MKKTIISLIIFLFTTIAANSGENSYKGKLDNCQDYKISPNAVLCEIHKAGSNFKKALVTKKDGSQNFLGKWFNSKSFTDVLEK